ncbi:MAG: hypothetical protein K0U93_21090 [Gammaproteobacteria bacterium]|nr:hypothetical protein [Gammaproteobacteria bacterium]
MKSKLLCAAIVAAASGVAFAAAPAFDDVDADKNGAITPSEALAVDGLDFSKADVDGDGKLNRAEYEEATASM